MRVLSVVTSKVSSVLLSMLGAGVCGWTQDFPSIGQETKDESFTDVLQWVTAIWYDARAGLRKAKTPKHVSLGGSTTPTVPRLLVVNICMHVRNSSTKLTSLEHKIQSVFWKPDRQQLDNNLVYSKLRATSFGVKRSFPRYLSLSV